MTAAAAVSPQRRAAATIVAKNYLSFARVLACSFHAHHPEVPFFVLLTDEVEGSFDPAAEPFQLLRLTDLPIPDPRRFRFRYSRRQAAVAGKPYLIAHLLDRGWSSVVFLDSDILVLGELSSLLARVDQHAIVLTPHLLAPLAGFGRAARELNILRSGVYNVGFLGVSDRPASRELLAWWQDRLHSHCRVAVEQGLHLDQRWIDLVPGFFAGVHILRDPGCNVAYWNLHERQLEVRENAVEVDGRPCRFFHFSGFSPEEPLTVTKHSRRLRMADLGPARELFERYLEALAAAGYQETRGLPYSYDHFDNGVAIPDVAREVYLALDTGVAGDTGGGVSCFGDPFAAAAPHSYFHWLNQAVDQIADPARQVTRLWEAIYRQRPDVQRAFPDFLGADRDAFLAWTSDAGIREYALPEPFLATGGQPQAADPQPSSSQNGMAAVSGRARSAASSATPTLPW